MNAENSLSREIWEWVKAIVFAVGMALIIRILLFTPIVVDGESMKPTLEDGERLIVNKVVYLLGEPERGDIIVFQAAPGKDWIKRVIGKPGDLIEVQDGKLYINGELYPEPYLDQNSDYRMENIKVKVPENELFVMGDNRPNSRDSRSIGTIPIDSVVGRAEFVFWPIKEFRFVH